jgi:hypothetical protein
MADFYEWLENIPQPYAPTSPPFAAPAAPPLMPMDRQGLEADDITPLNIDGDGQIYFDIPLWYMQGVQPEQHVAPEPPPIDPSLVVMPNAPNQRVVAVPEHLADASSKILIYLAQLLDVPEAAENADEPDEELAFTAEELEALEPIDEESFETPFPSTIDGIRVEANPRVRDIKAIIDLRRIGPHRQTFHLARTFKGSYYWFFSPRAGRGLRLNRLIGEYRRNSQAGVAYGNEGGTKKLRSGRTVRT